MNKVYIVRYYDTIQHVFATREKAEEYLKLLDNPMNIRYDTDYIIDEYELKDDCLNEEYYSVEATVYADRHMKKTLDCIKVQLINGADIDIYGNDSDIDFRYSTAGYRSKDTYCNFVLCAQFLKTSDGSIDKIKDRYIEAANKAFEKCMELIERGTTMEDALRVINKKLKEEGI